ncbi:DUF3558 domain-containing protein [Nocardia sp. NBC_00416]|uniref:DUF3558 domain-containing protein n=1 Tax=Nocardia sp. NBC_00416 TaxID=2975991 RepID=UPI002E21B82E
MGSARRALTSLSVLFGCVLVLMSTGCGSTIDGSAVPAGGSEQLDVNFDKLLRECEVVDRVTIGEAVGGQIASGEFNGAVCMWLVPDAPGGNAMVTLNWYENGTLSNEKTTYGELGYTSQIIEVESSQGLAIRRPGDPDSCGITASAPDAGVVGWWVNYHQGSAHQDPCEPVKKLMTLTLNRAR